MTYVVGPIRVITPSNVPTGISSIAVCDALSAVENVNVIGVVEVEDCSASASVMIETANTRWRVE